MSNFPREEVSKAAFGEQLVANLHPIYQGSFEYTVGNTELNTNIINGELLWKEIF